MEFGDWLRQKRKDKKIGVRELGRKIGVSQTCISQIELKQRNPSIKMLRELSKTLDIPYVDILLAVGYLTADDIPVLYELQEIDFLKRENKMLREKLKEISMISNGF